MAGSKRTQIYLTHRQWDAVVAAARRRGVSAAEVVREAIDRYLAAKPDFRATVHAVAGSWQKAPSDSTAYVRRLRAEWEERPHG